MKENITKVDDSTIDVVKVEPEIVVPQKTKTVRYDYDFLLEQRERIQKDYDETVARHAIEIATRVSELNEVNSLIATCEEMGLKSNKPVEEVIE